MKGVVSANVSCLQLDNQLLATFHCDIVLSSHLQIVFYDYQLINWSPTSTRQDLYIAFQTIQPRHSSQCVSELPIKLGTGMKNGPLITRWCLIR